MNKHEKAVRDAAASLQSAIVDARAAGLSVVWPMSPDGLASIAISETSKSAATVELHAPETVSAATKAKAQSAAQKAAERVIDKS